MTRCHSLITTEISLHGLKYTVFCLLRNFIWVTDLEHSTYTKSVCIKVCQSKVLISLESHNWFQLSWTPPLKMQSHLPLFGKFCEQNIIISIGIHTGNFVWGFCNCEFHMRMKDFPMYCEFCVRMMVPFRGNSMLHPMTTLWGTPSLTASEACVQLFQFCLALCHPVTCDGVPRKL